MNKQDVTTAERPSAAESPDYPRCPACEGALSAPSLHAPDRLCGLPGHFSVSCCQSCGMGVTAPMVSESELASFYPQTYGTYEQLPTGALGLVSRTVQALQSWGALHAEPFRRVARFPPGRLLDVGCGRGDLGAGFVRRGWSVVGVDPSAQACEVARKRGVQVRVGTLASLEIETDAYDVVVFRHSLEHVADPLGDLRRVRGALRDGGLLIVSVPNFGSWQRERLGGHWFMLDLPRHRFHFNASALETMLVRARFQSVQTMTSSVALGLPSSVQYSFAGRCLFPSGMSQRVAVGLCYLALPLVYVLDRVAGEGDNLHAIGRC
jgi:SAM-dependent methyltransferase